MEVYSLNKKKFSKQKKAAIIGLILLLLGNLLMFLAFWLDNEYDSIYLDQVVFQTKSSLEGVHSKLVYSAFLSVGIYGGLLTFAESMLYLFFAGRFKKLRSRWKGYLAYCEKKIACFIKKLALPFGALMLIISIIIFTVMLKLPTYFGAALLHSDFIEEHYVSPESVSVSFPGTKRNLIYIYLESMENTVSDPAAGGNITENFIPELTDLAKENVSFSHSESMGGAFSFYGTTWTSGAMVSHSGGVPLKTPLNAPQYGGENGFMPGLITLGDLLEEQGYNQTYLIGSNGEFGGRKPFYEEHGNFKILDTESLKEAGRLPKDYLEWWGFEDAKLFEFAKEELAELSRKDQPFNLTILTCDTHFPSGYQCSDCESEYELPYSNVYACSSKRVAAFIDWIKQQPYYENTTIILVGDHLTMDPQYIRDTADGYTRTTYNCFINAAATPTNVSNRSYGTIDLFPTTLAAMGARIEGDRLGLGTNLFSDQKTLTEEYGYDFLNFELLKRSDFYNKEFLHMD